MRLVDAELKARELIQARFEALCVELLGARASGLSAERIAALIEEGHLDPAAIYSADGERRADPLNPILFIRLAGGPYFDADNATRAQMRDATLREWVERLAPIISAREEAPPRKVDATAPLFKIERPTAPGDLRELPLNSVPAWVSQSERAGLVDAYRNAGAYIRGLGVDFADEMSARLFERWGGARLLDTPDPAKRAAALEVIRAEVGAAVLTHDTAAEVAGRIRQRTGDLARNFQRIAETELQAAHNEGQLYHALYTGGEGARIARIPETTACQTCRALFLNPDQTPRLFTPAELIAGGVNVGRRRADYRATVYPPHPRCRCDTITVRHGQTVTRDGRITADKGAP
jgi:hypothetical protein